MAEAMTRELKAMGIPFFGLSSRYLQDHSGQDQYQLLTKDSLLVLQRRMLELLQDLCKG